MWLREGGRAADRNPAVCTGVRERVRSRHWQRHTAGSVGSEGGLKEVGGLEQSYLSSDVLHSINVHGWQRMV